MGYIVAIGDGWAKVWAVPDADGWADGCTSGNHDFAIFVSICTYSAIYANIASIALIASKDKSPSL